MHKQKNSAPTIALTLVLTLVSWLGKNNDFSQNNDVRSKKARVAGYNLQKIKGASVCVSIEEKTRVRHDRSHSRSHTGFIVREE